MLRFGSEEGKRKLNPVGDFRHPMQRQMLDRMDWMNSLIRGEGEKGMEEVETVRLMFVNRGVSPRLTKEYLSIASQSGKLRKEGTRYVCLQDD